MAAPGTLIQFSPNTLIKSADVNTNGATLRNAALTAAYVDTANAWTISQPFSAGITVSGAATFSSGVITFSSGVTFASGTTVTASGLTVAGNPAFSGAVTVSSLIVSNNATLNAALNVVGALTVTGASVFGGNVTMSAALNVVGNVQVTGNLTVSGSFVPTRAWPGQTTVASPGLSFNGFQDTGLHALANASGTNTLDVVSGGTVGIIVDAARVTPQVLVPVGINVAVGATLATNATVGYFCIPTFPSTGTGVPTAPAGTVALMYETGANHLMVYNAGWKAVALT